MIFDPGGGAIKCAVAHPIHVSSSHTKFGRISFNGSGGDSITDRPMDKRRQQQCFFKNTVVIQLWQFGFRHLSCSISSFNHR